MWERSARQNPLSLRYQWYRDHRPYLPQDRTADWLSGRHSDFNMIYYIFKSNKNLRYLCSNNMPANDRVLLEKLTYADGYFRRKMGTFSLIPGTFLSGLIFSSFKLKYKILYPVLFYLSWSLANSALLTYFDSFQADNMSSFYYKYFTMTHKSLAEVDDPRRKFFRLDTDVYYRETADEIIHKEHHGEGHGGHHDTSTYYGPYPVFYF
jgi:hypothetical protein